MADTDASRAAAARERKPIPLRVADALTIPRERMTPIQGGAVRVTYPDGSTALIPDPAIVLVPGPPSQA